ncbi:MULTISPECIES: SCO6880 family protein [Nocardiaceae]|uniref:SCO6880 family protein n=3 Tax=Mycobacteriales TaxID=85007 RepID=UPI00068ABF44|nr:MULTISPECIES: SCO6880 family protein [Rhodococcus]OLT34574.1 hypothetical protein BJF84_17380 [Rhodococcus sp. CUA-806]OZF41284.1 PrgI family protein [Rhodococcus sp. 14-2470-1a]OZF41398.1 PrgI family protein [Rhodococcus sp. 14-2470-1a]QII03916.1 PrgI family protein [Rhodococcus fascians A21d2]
MSTTSAPMRRRQTYVIGPVPKESFLLGLNIAASVYLFGCALMGVGVLSIADNKLYALAFIGVMAITALPLILRFQRKTYYQWIALSVQWLIHLSKGENLYLSGRFSRVPGGTNRLPGVLYDSVLHDGWVQHQSRQKFGVIEMPKTHQFTIVIECWPQGNEAIDQDAVDNSVFSWGAAVNFISQTGDVDGVTVVIENGPESGNRLRREVRSMAHEDGFYGGELPARMMLESAEYLATGTPRLWARVAITYRAATASRRKDPGEQIKELARRIGGVLTVLNEAQLNPRLLASDEIVSFVKHAYTPAALDDLELSEMKGGHDLGWEDAGPQAQKANISNLFHDGCYSTTWEMAERPKNAFVETVLRPLLDPNPDVLRKRVAICYRPHSPAEAATIIGRDLKHANSGVNNLGKKGPSFEAQQRLKSVEDQLEEQGHGHGLTMIGLLVTVTTPEGEDRPKADSVTKDLGTRSSLRLQRLWFTQDTGFAATLGVGVLMPSHTKNVAKKLGA